MKLLLTLFLVLAHITLGHAQTMLPPPIGHGAAAALLGPSPLSAPLGGHLRLTGYAASAQEDARDWSGGLHAAGSVTLWERGEAGVSYLLQLGPGVRHGPLTGWLRIGPFFPVSPDRSGLLVAPFLEYAAAPPPFDATGSLFRDTLALGTTVGHHRGRWLAYLSGAYQRGESPGVLYQGGQLGAAFFGRAGADLEIGGEVLARMGCQDGTCGHSVIGVLQVRLFDRHGVGFAGGAGRGWGAGAPGWLAAARLALSLGQGWQLPPRDPATPRLLPTQEEIDASWAQFLAARAAAAAAARLALGPPLPIPHELPPAKVITLAQALPPPRPPLFRIPRQLRGRAAEPEQLELIYPPRPTTMGPAGTPAPPPPSPRIPAPPPPNQAYRVVAQPGQPFPRYVPIAEIPKEARPVQPGEGPAPPGSTTILTPNGQVLRVPLAMGTGVMGPPPPPPPGPVGPWQRVITPWQREVFQRADIDWNAVRPAGVPHEGRTNEYAAARGVAPGRVNPVTGKWEVAVLHHLGQNPRGALVETWRSPHARLPHKMDQPGNWRAENPAWADAFRDEQKGYWRWRTGRYDPPVRDRLLLPGDR